MKLSNININIVFALDILLPLIFMVLGYYYQNKITFAIGTAYLITNTLIVIYLKYFFLKKVN